MAGSGLFFGASTGRSGTMLLANLLNSEPGVTCLHEGKFRNREEPGDQVLAYLTLENVLAYHNRSAAEDIFRRKRGAVRSLAENKLFGDIAYNYAPFVDVMPRVFDDAKLVVMFRDGREFVRSVVTDQDPDPTPVGWKAGRVSSKVERFISLGRLRPAQEDPLSTEWPTLSVVAKNAWLWAETNRLILEGLRAWRDSHVLQVKFETFVSDMPSTYSQVRQFLGIEGKPSAETRSLMNAPINRRSAKKMPDWHMWKSDEQQDFMRFAGNTMKHLGYSV